MFCLQNAKLHTLDDKPPKSQSSESKDRDSTVSRSVPLPEWADKNRQPDREREKLRSSNDRLDDKPRHDSFDYRHGIQVP